MGDAAKEQEVTPHDMDGPLTEDEKKALARADILERALAWGARPAPGRGRKYTKYKAIVFRSQFRELAKSRAVNPRHEDDILATLANSIP